MSSVRTFLPSLALCVAIACSYIYFSIRDPQVSQSPGSHRSPRYFLPSQSKDVTRSKRDEMVQRMKRMREVCAKYGDRARWKGPFPGNALYIDYKNHFAVCKNAKVATTTLSRMFLRLANVNVGPDPHKKARWLLSRYHRSGVTKSVARLAKYLKWKRIFLVSFVRHPLARLVSAFRDKVLHKYKRRFASTVGRNFTLFVDLVLNDIEKSNCGDLGSDCKMNPHWRPYYSRCAYCDLPYRVIGKLEDFAADLSYATSQAGLTETIRLSKKGRRGKSGDYRRYLDKLDYGRRRRLFDHFRLDFELFGYDAESFLHRSKPK